MVEPDTRKKSFAEWVEEVLQRECPAHGVSLDIGCGHQRYRAAYRNRVVGYDIRPAVAPEVVGTIERLPFSDDSFDFVTSFQCLYYSEDAPATADELVRVLKPGGQAVVSVSSFGHLYWEHLNGRLAVGVRSRRWWAQRFNEIGCRTSNFTMPPRYRGISGSLRPGILSPYRFLRVETAPWQ